MSSSSVSLSSPLLPLCKFFPDDGRLHHPDSARLLPAESHDASLGPQMSPITILASDLDAEKHLIKRRECNLLIIQNRKKHKSFDFKQDTAARAVTSYFTLVDTAFAHCLEFLQHMNHSDEWDQDRHLMTFMRALNTAVDRMPQRAEIVNIFRSKRPAKNRLNLHGNAWGFIKHVGCGVHPAKPIDTPIPAKIHCEVRQIVFDIWGWALEVLFREKMNEFIALINHPMLTFLNGRLPPGIGGTLRRMDNFGQSPIPRDRDTRPVMESLIRDWSYFTKFKGDLDALRKVYDWKQANNDGHVVLNLLHRCDEEDDAIFDLMRTALVSMGWDENDITIVSDEDSC